MRRALQVTTCSDWYGASEFATKLFLDLGRIYGNLWIREHGEKPANDFNNFANEIAPEQVARIIRRAKEEKIAGCNFPPSIGDLYLWATHPTDSEFYEIRSRVMAGQYKNEIERWLVAKCRYNLRRTHENQFMKALKGFYSQAVELDRAGQLFAEEHEILALPAESSVNEVYQHMGQIDVSTGVKNRIARIRAKAGKEKAPEIDSEQTKPKTGTVAPTNARKRRLPHKS